MQTPSTHSRSARVRIPLILTTAFALVVTTLASAPWGPTAAPAEAAAPAAAAATSAGKELLANPTFARGKSGWATKGSNQKLRVVKQTSGKKIARLTVKKTGNATLNDRPNSVRNASKGTTYKVSARVRTTIPKTAGVKGALQVRELVGDKSVKTSKALFKLTNKKWKTVNLTVNTLRAGSKLDVNVTAVKLSKKKNLQVKRVSVKRVVISSPKPDPGTNDSDKTESDNGSNGSNDTCDVRKVPKGTAFGTSISTSSQSTEEAVKGIDKLFGRVPTIRVFDGGMVNPWSHNRTKSIAGRDLVISFRPMPDVVLSGKHDKEFREWFKQAPSNVTIYWSYIHEPEPLIDQGKFTAAEYRRAWQHIDAIADEVCRSNMYPTLTLTGWTASAPDRDWRDYYPGSKVIEVMAFDPYNGVHDPERDEYYSPARLYDSVRKVAKEAGKPWAIAETGSRVIPSDQNPKGAKRAKWLADVAKYSRDNGAVFVTYFHSSRDGEWRLLDTPSANAWAAAIKSS